MIFYLFRYIVLSNIRNYNDITLTYCYFEYKKMMLKNKNNYYYRLFIL